jgi:hypothetical protein
MPISEGRNVDRDHSRFCGREQELQEFRSLLTNSDPKARGALAFYGVAGVGKTWLLRRLQQEAQEFGLRSARLDFDRQTGGSAIPDDFPYALYSLRNQLKVECPSFELAYAWMRHKRGQSARPELKGEGVAAKFVELIEKIAEKAIDLGTFGHVKNWASAEVFLIKAGLGKAWDSFRESASMRSVLDRIGFDDYVNLGQATDSDIEHELIPRLARDLEAGLRTPKANLTGSGRPLCLVVVDGMEYFDLGHTAPHLQHLADQWVRDLCQEAKHFIQFVFAGQNKLDWHDANPDWSTDLLLRELSGLTRQEAESYLSRWGINPGELLEAILRVSQLGSGYHPLTLSFCADIVRVKPSITPREFNISSGDWKGLARRFLRSVSDPADRLWFIRLALSPLWDEAAARAAYDDGKGRRQDAAWERLHTFSFIHRQDGGWYSIRDLVAEALIHDAKPYEVREGRQFWQDYWSNLPGKTTFHDGLAWVQRWYLNPAKGRMEMEHAFSVARQRYDVEANEAINECLSRVRRADSINDFEVAAFELLRAEVIAVRSLFVGSKEDARRADALLRETRPVFEKLSNYFALLRLQQDMISLALNPVASFDSTYMQAVRRESLSLLRSVDDLPISKQIDDVSEFLPNTLDTMTCRENFEALRARLRRGTLELEFALGEGNPSTILGTALELLRHTGRDWEQFIGLLEFIVGLMRSSKGVAVKMHFARTCIGVIQLAQDAPPHHYAQIVCNVSPLLLDLMDEGLYDVQDIITLSRSAEAKLSPTNFPIPWILTRSLHLFALTSKEVREQHAPSNSVVLWNETLGELGRLSKFNQDLVERQPAFISDKLNDVARELNSSTVPPFQLPPDLSPSST